MTWDFDPKSLAKQFKSMEIIFMFAFYGSCFSILQQFDLALFFSKVELLLFDL